MSMIRKSFVCTTILIVVLALNLVLSQCWDGWEHFNTSCYLFPKVYADWHKAKFECEGSFGGYLAEINSFEENEFVRNEAKGHNIDPSNQKLGYWIGGSDMEVENKWIWMKSRQPFEFSDWPPYEPNNREGHEDCLQLYKLYDFHWNDYKCREDGFFICEKPILPGPDGIFG